MSDQPTSSTTPTGHQSSPPTGTDTDPAGPGAQPLSERGTNRSLRPGSPAFKELISRGWGERPPPPERAEAAPWAAARREMLSELFPGDRLVVPAGPLKVRSNDTDYRYRPHAAFSHLTGLGADREPDAVLVLEPRSASGGGGHEALLFVRPRAERDSEEFYADARYGEFWVGVRPSLQETTAELGITARHVDELPAVLDGLLPDGTDPAADVAAVDAGAAPEAGTGSDEASGVSRLRIVVDADPAVSAAVGRSFADGAPVATDGDDELSELLSTMRLVKDEWEVGQMREAVAATVTGFEQVVCSLPRAAAHRRGERVVETAFEGVARREGNGVGYETIAAAGEHACTLHWIRNDGPVPGDALVLVDAGVEIESLYTADVTRTLPVSGRYTDVQRRVYSAVLEAADAGFAACRPGNVFRDVHDAAMGVIAARLHEWGILDVSVEEALDADEGGQHRRWMVHGTSHHLGIDVHDCAQARRDAYLDAELVPGMILTIEPGLYFKPDDLLVPEELRGIGVRIEDDVLVTADGCENLSAALPREPGAVEAWMASLR